MLAHVPLDRLEVERLAAELGATKGSFYWHFTNRAELIEAIADSWERDATTRVIDEVGSAPANERVSRLLHVAFGPAAEARIEWAILSSTSVAAVASVVERVHAARIGYIERLFAEQGLPRARADARARILYAAYLGYLQMAAGHGGTEASARRSRAHSGFLAEARDARARAVIGSPQRRQRSRARSAPIVSASAAGLASAPVR